MDRCSIVVCHHHHLHHRGSRRRGAARAPGGARRRGIGGPAARYPKPLERTEAHWRFDGSAGREERCCRLVARLRTKLSAPPTNRHPRSRVRDAEARVGRLRRDPLPPLHPLQLHAPASCARVGRRKDEKSLLSACFPASPRENVFNVRG